jgi:hypothetical protein
MILTSNPDTSIRPIEGQVAFGKLAGFSGQANLL